MVKPIPENIKTLLSELSPTQQVAIRGYIASLRSEIKDLEAELLAKTDPDPHAHYHGDKKCTIDHDHKGHDHEHHKHGHKDHDHHGHEHHDHHDEKPCTVDHDHHGHHDEKPCTIEHDHHGHHAHEHHHDEKPCTIDHDHDRSHKHDHQHHDNTGDHKGGHEHHHKGHEHKHDHSDTMPAWKKKALETGNNDPSEAPFGGDWNSETIRNLNEDKMEE
jgi:hypothetical protein